MKGESAYWYHKNDENLLICGVGGKNNFGSFFKEKILPAMVDSDAFLRIAVVIDRDDQEEQSILDSFRLVFRPIITNIESDIWVSNYYENSYKQKSLADFLLVVIPADKEGALETLLLDAISENEYDEAIVKR